MKTAIVVTSINAPGSSMRAITLGSMRAKHDFIVIGDTKSPSDYTLAGCQYLDVNSQLASGLRFAQACPTGHYARKNIGYLTAIANGAELIVETDDDNTPRDGFFEPRNRLVRAAICREAGWVNVYRYFSASNIWPRGLPLQEIHSEIVPFDELPVVEVDCPIQQGLADENPDVDAIYRLTLPLPQKFRTDRRLVMGHGSWCPFNSQNTTWWPDAFPLLYLPAYCSFRMTDIWRSFIAQRIAWANGWSILFHEPTVWQDRNEHDLMRDFAGEVPGYLNNDRISKTLEDLEISGSHRAMGADLRKCYEALATLDLVGRDELNLLNAWLTDIELLNAGG